MLRTLFVRQPGSGGAVGEWHLQQGPLCARSVAREADLPPAVGFSGGGGAAVGSGSSLADSAIDADSKVCEQR